MSREYTLQRAPSATAFNIDRSRVRGALERVFAGHRAIPVAAVDYRRNSSAPPPIQNARAVRKDSFPLKPVEIAQSGNSGLAEIEFFRGFFRFLRGTPEMW